MSELIDREAAISKIEPWLYSEGRGESEFSMGTAATCPF